mmetsp:Transcript_20568/g.44159  ORF Transcript_20568/g.44159 Transcript_20568/m.44159 type:complete len:213 (-) Transcript_20568:454-1092(-)
MNSIRDLEHALKLDTSLDTDDFPLVLRSPTEVDGLDSSSASSEDNVDKFQLRPRPSQNITAGHDDVHEDEDKEDDAEAEDALSILNFSNASASVQQGRFCLFTPPPGLTLKPKLRPRPRARRGVLAPALPAARWDPPGGDEDPSAAAPAPFPRLGRSAFSAREVAPPASMMPPPPTATAITNVEDSGDAPLPLLAPVKVTDPKRLDALLAEI